MIEKKIKRSVVSKILWLKCYIWDNIYYGLFRRITFQLFQILAGYPSFKINVAYQIFSRKTYKQQYLSLVRKLNWFYLWIMLQYTEILYQYHCTLYSSTIWILYRLCLRSQMLFISCKDKPKSSRWRIWKWAKLSVPFIISNSL